MAVEFFIDPKDPDPAEGKVWYVKQLDYIHCICTSYERALWVEAGIKLAHNDELELSKKRDREVVWKRENTTLTTRSELAEIAIDSAKWKLQSEKDLRPAVQVPESQPQATTSDSPKNTTKSNLDI